MAKLEDGGVQGLPPEVSQRGRLSGVAGLAPVDRITHDGTSDMSQMDANLVCSSGAKTGSQQAGHGGKRRPEPLLHPVLRKRCPAAGGADRHALAVDRMAADGRLY